MNRSLALLKAADDDLPGPEVRRLALQKAVAEGDGAGGMGRLRGPATPSLYLAASSGLPLTYTRRWQHICGDATAAPAAATRLCRSVWFPAPEGPGTGMASVPLRTAHGEPFGALTIVTATAGGPPGPARGGLPNPGRRGAPPPGQGEPAPPPPRGPPR